MGNPLVSVIMPVYEKQEFLKEALDSLKNQTFQDFELILVGVEKNLAKALNKGIKMAKGKYIARMDSDDTCEPRRLERQVELLDNNCVHMIYQSDGRESRMLYWNNIIHGSVMIRNGTFGLYNEKFKAAQDYELWLRTKFWKVCIKNIYNRRIHPNMTNRRKQTYYSMKARLKYWREFDRTAWWHMLKSFGRLVCG